MVGKDDLDVPRLPRQGEIDWAYDVSKTLKLKFQSKKKSSTI